MSVQSTIKRKTAPFDATAFKDHYTKALRSLIDQRLKGKAPKVETEDERPSGGNVIDLMAALKQSLEGSGGASRGGGRAEAKASGKTNGAGKAAPKSGTGSKARTPAKSASNKAGARAKPAQKARKSA